MDIGVPFRDLGKIDVGPLLGYVRGLSDEDWRRNPLRQEAFADGVHSVTESIILKHEWHPSNNSVGYRYLEDLIHAWALSRKLDPAPFMPVERRDTDLGSVYTFREWDDLRSIVEPIVDRAIALLRARAGVVTRVVLVRLHPGGRIMPHVDRQPMAASAHRVHLPVICPPGVEYKIDGRKLRMAAGHAYDFNNRVRHSVVHTGKLPRVNLFVDFYPNPGTAVRPAYDMGPVFAATAARVVR